MPTVRKGSRQVSTMALPGVRLTAAETPESKGAGLAIAKGRTTEAIGQLGGTVATVAYHEYTRMQEEERQKADQIAILGAKNKKDAWQLQRLYDSKTGALQMKGSDAFGLPEAVDQDLAKINSEIEQGLGNDRQKLAWARIKSQDDNNVRMTIQRHVAGQRQAFDANENQATVQNKHSLAVANALDPKRAAQELNDGVTAIQQFGQRNGLGPEAVSAQVNAFRSDTHIGIISNLLANEQTKAAQIYFEETKHDISGDKLDDVTRALKVGTTKKQSQEQTQRILAEGGTLAEQRAKAKQIDDPDVQDDVLARIEHEQVVRNAQQQQAEEARSRTVYDTLDKTHSVDQIEAATWADMSGAERSNARAYAAHLAAGTPIATDWNLFYAMKTMASTEPGTTLPDGRTPLSREDFLKENLTQYRSSLGDSEFKELIELQTAMRTGDAKKTADALGGFQTKQQLLSNTLITFGLNPNPDEKTATGKQEALRNAQIARTLDARLAAFEAPDQHGKATKASQADIQQMLDDILTQAASVTQPAGYFSGYLPGNFGNFAPTKQVPKHLYDLTAADIPAALRSQIDAALRALGQPVMDQTRLDYYRNSLVK